MIMTHPMPPLPPSGTVESLPGAPYDFANKKSKGKKEVSTMIADEFLVELN